MRRVAVPFCSKRRTALRHPRSAEELVYAPLSGARTLWQLWSSRLNDPTIQSMTDVQTLITRAHFVLESSSVRRGDIVLLPSQMTAHVLLLLLAVTAAGAVPAVARSSPASFMLAASDCKPKCVVLPHAEAAPFLKSLFHQCNAGGKSWGSVREMLKAVVVLPREPFAERKCGVEEEPHLSPSQPSLSTDSALLEGNGASTGVVNADASPGSEMRQTAVEVWDGASSSDKRKGLAVVAPDDPRYAFSPPVVRDSRFGGGTVQVVDPFLRPLDPNDVRSYSDRVAVYEMDDIIRCDGVVAARARHVTPCDKASPADDALWVYDVICDDVDGAQSDQASSGGGGDDADSSCMAPSESIRAYSCSHQPQKEKEATSVSVVRYRHHHLVAAATSFATTYHAHSDVWSGVRAKVRTTMPWYPTSAEPEMEELGEHPPEEVRRSRSSWVSRMGGVSNEEASERYEALRERGRYAAVVSKYPPGAIMIDPDVPTALAVAASLGWVMQGGNVSFGSATTALPESLDDVRAVSFAQTVAHHVQQRTRDAVADAVTSLARRCGAIVPGLGRAVMQWCPAPPPRPATWGLREVSPKLYVVSALSFARFREVFGEIAAATSDQRTSSDDEGEPDGALSSGLNMRHLRTAVRELVGDEMQLLLVAQPWGVDPLSDDPAGSPTAGRVAGGDRDGALFREVVPVGYCAYTRTTAGVALLTSGAVRDGVPEYIPAPCVQVELEAGGSDAPFRLHSDGSLVDDAVAVTFTCQGPATAKVEGGVEDVLDGTFMPSGVLTVRCLV